MTDHPSSLPSADESGQSDDTLKMAEAGPEPAPTAKTRDGLARGLSLLALAAGLGALAFSQALPITQRSMPPAPAAPEFQALQKQVMALEEKLAQMEAAPPPAPVVTPMPSPQPDAAISAPPASKEQLQAALDEITALRAKFGTLQEDIADAEALKRDMAQIKNEIAVANSAISGMRGHVQQMTDSAQQAAAAEASSRAQILAYLQLRAATAMAAPFIKELQSLCELTTMLPALAAECVKLETPAYAGVATLPMLQGRFAVMAPTAERAVAMAEAKSWTDRVKVSLDEVVRIRKVGESGEAEMPKLAHDASAALQRGNLAEALAKVEAMPPLARQALQEWLGDARARLALDEALVRVGTALGQVPMPASPADKAALDAAIPATQPGQAGETAP